MLGDLAAERLPFLGVADRDVERPLGNADAARGDVHAADLDARHHLLEPAPLLAAEQVRRRDAVIGEDQLRCLDPLVAELLELGRDREAALLRRTRLLLDEQAAHPPVGRRGVGVGLHERRDHA